MKTREQEFERILTEVEEVADFLAGLRSAYSEADHNGRLVWGACENAAKRMLKLAAEAKVTAESRLFEGENE